MTGILARAYVKALIGYECANKPYRSEMQCSLLSRADAVIGNAQTYRAAARMQQSFRHFARGLQDERIASGCRRFQQAEVRVIELRVLRNLSQIAAHERQVVPFVHPTDGTHALHRGLVADVTTERIARIRRVNDDAPAANDLGSFADQSGLGILRMD